MTEETIKTNFARNVRDLRLSRGLNQIQLGEKIHYSSKAISKWENGDVLPDVVTLNMIADFFDITVDDLISNSNVVRKSHKRRNHIYITASSCLLPFFIATIVFTILTILEFPCAWRSYIAILPASSITLIVLSSLWFNKVIRNSAIVATIIFIGLLILVFTNFPDWWWIIVIASATLSLIAIIFFNIKFGSNKNEE